MDDQSLLRWGIEHSAPGSMQPLAEDIKAGRRPDLNTDVLRAIMGVSDADRMRECVKVIEGTYVNREEGPRGAPRDASEDGRQATKEDKLLAWTDLEMLVEDIDNANDLANLGLWKPIVGHLSDEDDDVVCQACWVCGTAVQNNPKAQDAFLKLNPLPTLLPLVTSSSSSPGTRSKAMYCLSSTLKHSQSAVTTFSSLDGWKTLNDALLDSSLTLRSKTAFLLAQLVLQSPSPNDLVTDLRTSSVLSTLLHSLSPQHAIPAGPNGEIETIDPDYKEKALRVFVNIASTSPKALKSDEKKQLREIVDGFADEPDWNLQDLGFAEEEWNSFKDTLQ